jgi:hypothetical protein
MALNTADEILNSALPEWHKLLQGWAADGSLVAAAKEALMLPGEPEALKNQVAQWSTGDFSGMPPIVLLPSADINGALGAYAISTGTIYLNADWLAAASKDQVNAVLTEELGHHLDALLNAVDTLGDEGEVFSSLLMSESTSPASSKTNDSILISVNGVSIQAEGAIATNPVDKGPGTLSAITGNGPFNEGVILSAGSISGDPDGGSDSPNLAYQWLLNGNAIQGATRSTVNTTATGFGAYSVNVTYTDGQGFVATVSSGTQLVAEKGVRLTLDNSYSPLPQLYHYVSPETNLVGGYNFFDWAFYDLSTSSNPANIAAIRSGSELKVETVIAGQNTPTWGIDTLRPEVDGYWLQGTSGDDSIRFSLGRTRDSIGLSLAILRTGSGNDAVYFDDISLMDAAYMSTPEYNGGSGYDTLAINDYSSNYQYYSSDHQNSNRWELISKTVLRNRRLSSANPISTYPDSLAESGIPAYPRMVLFNVEELQFIDKSIFLTPTPAVGTITNEDVALPSITQTVSPSTVIEDGTANLNYAFSRTGNTSNPLTVNYTVGGTATLGSDYTGINSTPATKTVTFAAGSATEVVTVDPTADASIEPDETVELTITPGTGYIIGTTTAVSGTISNDDSVRVIRVAGVRNSYVFDGKATTLDVAFSDGYESRFFWHLGITEKTPYYEALQAWIKDNGLPRLNSQPSALTLSSKSFNENIAAGTTVATLGTTDPDSGDTFSYLLAPGIDSNDNTAFSILDNQLKITNSPDFETKPSYKIRLRTTDAGGLSLESGFNLIVNDLQETAIPPQVLANNPSTTGNNSPATSVSNGSGTTIINNITNNIINNTINNNNTTTNNINNSITITGSFNGNVSAQALAGSLKLEDPVTKSALPVNGDSAIKTLAQLTASKPLSDAARQLLDRYTIKDPSSSSSRKASASDAGFIDFTLKTGSLKSLTAEIALASEVKATAYVKVNPNTGEAYDFTFDPVTGLGAELLDTNKNGLVDSLRIHLQDGARGDVDGVVNGEIHDPGVLAEAPRLPVYRFYRNGVHFYTTNSAERDSVIANSYGKGIGFADLSANPQAKDPVTGGWGYRYEGVAYQALDTQGTALYRFYSPSKGYHFVTTNADEALTVIQKSVGSSYNFSNAKDQKLLDTGWGFQYEETSYKVSTIAQIGMDTPVYRFYNQQRAVHFYSSSMEETKSVIAKSLGAQYATDDWITSTADAIKRNSPYTSPTPLASGWGYQFEGVGWYV